MSVRVFVPMDASALSVGAEEVAHPREAHAALERLAEMLLDDRGQARPDMGRERLADVEMLAAYGKLHRRSRFVSMVRGAGVGATRSLDGRGV